MICSVFFCNLNTCKSGATVKCLFIYLCHVFGNRYAFNFRTAPKRCRANACDAVWNNYICKLRTAVKSADIYGGYAVRYLNRIDHSTARKRIFADSGYRLSFIRRRYYYTAVSTGTYPRNRVAVFVQIKLKFKTIALPEGFAANSAKAVKIVLL